jgi:hypothetical protein
LDAKEGAINTEGVLFTKHFAANKFISVVYQNIARIYSDMQEN